MDEYNDPMYIHPTEPALEELRAKDDPLTLAVRSGYPFDYICENYEYDEEQKDMLLDLLQEWRDSGKPITYFINPNKEVSDKLRKIS